VICSEAQVLTMSEWHPATENCSI